MANSKDIKSVEFKFAGIEFKVDYFHDGEDKHFDELVGVSIWDEEKSKFEPISVDFEGFLDDMQEQIDYAVEEMNTNEALVAGDLVYDSMKDELINWENLEDK